VRSLIEVRGPISILLPCAHKSILLLSKLWISCSSILRPKIHFSFVPLPANRPPYEGRVALPRSGIQRALLASYCRHLDVCSTTHSMSFVRPNSFPGYCQKQYRDLGYAFVALIHLVEQSRQSDLAYEASLMNLVQYLMSVQSTFLGVGF
jgi:hypothetical protein